MSDKTNPKCIKENCHRKAEWWNNNSGFALCELHIMQNAFNVAHKEWQKEKEKLSCSFCGKSQDQVKKLIAGPEVYICNECVDLCVELVAKEKEEEASGGT